MVDFLQQETVSLAAEYERIHRRASEDPGTAGDQGEENWATLFKEWLPSTYHVVTKGRILSHEGSASPQVDVLILSPQYPSYLLDKKLYLAGGVLAAFECKVTLSKAALRDAASTAATIKRATMVRYGSPYRELHAPILYGVLAHSHDWKSQPSEINKSIIRTLFEADVANVAHPRETIDLVCTADLGLWHTSKDAWMGPSMVRLDPGSKDAWERGLRHIFGDNGSASTAFLGAVVPDPGGAGDAGFTPVGAMLARLLRRLAWEDPGLRPIAAYFRLARMEGGGPGSIRKWPQTIYSQNIREDVVEARHARPAGQRKPWDEDDMWDEWGNHFG